MDYATFKQRMRDEIMPMLAVACDPPQAARDWYAILTPEEQGYLRQWSAEQDQIIRDLAGVWSAFLRDLDTHTAHTLRTFVALLEAAVL